MTPLCIICPACKGTGQVPLPEHLQATWTYLKERGKLTTGQLRAALMPDTKSPSAMNNRLVALEELGLVKRDITDYHKHYWEALELK